MPAYKDSKTGKWYVQFRYVDWTGKRQQKLKRGFATKKEADQWERQFKIKEKADIDMHFSEFWELYEADMKPRLKLNTWLSKEHIVRTKILPYFGNKKLSEITARDVITWQNHLRTEIGSNGRPYSQTYLKTIHAVLSSIFNHAMRYYDLSVNPANKAGGMGAEESKEMLFWTKEEYLKFAEAVMDKPLFYYAFELLYWCGIRKGELLALTPEDFDFEKKTLRINKSYQRLQKRDVITTPKTQKSNRVISMSDFLCEEMKDCLKMFYHIGKRDRIFQFTKHGLYREMVRGSQASGVKKIRVHDLRHSHISLLVDMGFTAKAIGDRVGHESEHITNHYTHLFPSRQTEMADRLNDAREMEQQADSDKGGEEDVEKKAG